MATGGDLTDVDNRVTCSVCLEPYKGRQPKLLPCYHTFCLPCLDQLTCTGQEKKQGQTQTTITCPTCRAVHTLPPGGASSLQTNFYIDSSDAAVSCTQQDDLSTKVKEQLKVMEAVTSQLSEDEKEMERQRRAIEDDIRHRYKAGLQALDDCHDQCVNSVEDVTRQLTDKLQADVLFAHSLLKPLQDLAREGSSKPQTLNSSTDTHPALLSDSVLRHFRQQLTRNRQSPTPLFFYDHSDNTADLTNALRRFMGAVLPSGGTGASPQLTSDEQRKRAGESDQGPGFTAGGGEWGQSQQQQLRELQTLMLQMRTDNEQLKKQLAAVKGDMATSTDIGRLQKDLMAASTDIGSLRKDLTVVQKDTSENQQSLKQMDTVMSTLQSMDNRKTSPAVFFSVRLTQNVVLLRNEAVRIDKVVSNTGGGYDAATGIFTAPHTGTYLFIASAISDYNTDQCLKSSAKFACFCIMANSVKVASSWSKGPLSCTTHTVVSLQAGQQAFMKAEGYDKISLRGDGYTSFCGVLLN